ncbi:membrane protein [Alicyclobacillus contaminans]|uniref:sodium:calcium antiporter n=1 Tax=Alicyclobacillus contaminans TaxID=392016 RepID=UPI0004222BE1|nr:sodium:calcium antiporter [Alicyclobacillus contaminans]GMA52089.1 membrane protein [Alicyclobacillus contaminans]
MGTAATIVLSLAMILFGAELFTNGVEWLGRLFGLGEGTVGSILAALGTALPETAVPVAAILFGHGAAVAEEVGIGGILGAPFLLVTLGSAIVAVALWLFRRGQAHEYTLHLHPLRYRRDMMFFLVAYAVSFLAGCIPDEDSHYVASLLLIGIYGAFLFFTIRDTSDQVGSQSIHMLYMQWGKANRPRVGAVLLQLTLSLTAIVGGAQLLAKSVERLAAGWGMPPFVLSAILIPLATELPETLNSVVWIRQGKDALAIGNITGAMVFQSTLVPALGIALTKWRFNAEALTTGALTLAAGMLLFGIYRRRGRLHPGVLLAASMMYWVLPLQTVAARYPLQHWHWIAYAVLCLSFVWLLRRGLRVRHVG